MTKETGVLERLGLERVNKLDEKICLYRSRTLRRRIRLKRYDGELLDYAKYYANWYQWVSSQYGEHGKRVKSEVKKSKQG